MFTGELRHLKSRSNSLLALTWRWVRHYDSLPFINNSQTVWRSKIMMSSWEVIIAASKDFPYEITYCIQVFLSPWNAYEPNFWKIIYADLCLFLLFLATLCIKYYIWLSLMTGRWHTNLLRLCPRNILKWMQDISSQQWLASWTAAKSDWKLLCPRPVVNID